MFSLKTMPSTTSILSAYSAFTASAMLVRTVINEVQTMTTQLVPKQLQEMIISKTGSFWGTPSSQMITLIIDEYNGYSINQMYEASELYLGTKISSSLEKVRVLKAPRDKNLKLKINKGEKLLDTFQGIQLIWEIVCTETKEPVQNGRFDSRVIELSFSKKNMEKVLSSFLPFVMEKSNAIKEESKIVKLYSHGGGGEQEDGQWGSTNLDHPATFETLAMEPALKKALMDDLDRFVNRRDYYRRVGKAWKRGYLLYGPPGTGKSSLVAAMANYLKFHIYDLELGSIYGNSNLRDLLVSTKNRSIVVIEDIDCSIDFQNRQARRSSQLTLSGLLNFIDGLWSSCGDERIIVFTTNHKEKLKPALLRPGRMDMHINMSYCTPNGFKILASNYLGISDHSLFPRIDELITETRVTPAEIAEELMKSEDANASLNGLVEFLEKKKMERSELGEDDGKQEQESAEGETPVGSKRKARVGTFGGPKKIRSKRKAKEVPSMVETAGESEELPEQWMPCFHAGQEQITKF